MYAIQTSLYYQSDGRLAADWNEVPRLIAVCERREDAEAMATRLANEWREQCRADAYDPEDWAGLTHAQWDALPSVVELTPAAGKEK